MKAGIMVIAFCTIKNVYGFGRNGRKRCRQGRTKKKNMENNSGEQWCEKTEMDA